MPYMSGLHGTDQGIHAVGVDLLPRSWMNDDAEHFLWLPWQRAARGWRPTRSPGLAHIHRHPERVFELGCDASPRSSRGIQQAGNLQLMSLPSLLHVEVDTQSEPLGKPGNHVLRGGTADIARVAKPEGPSRGARPFRRRGRVAGTRGPGGSAPAQGAEAVRVNSLV